MVRDIIWVTLGAVVAGFAYYKLYKRYAPTPREKASWWTVAVLGTALVLWAGHNMVVAWLQSEM
jgi:uncharacterized membrane-anchored protein